MLLKQSVKNHFRVSRLTWLPLIFFTFIWYYTGFDRDYLRVVGIFLLVMNISAILLHIQYTFKNWNQTIEIYDGHLYISSENSTKVLKTNEICQVALFMSATLDNSGAAMFLPRESYHYIKLTTDEGEDIIITCLMSTQLAEIRRLFKHATFLRYKGGPFWL
ncbi:hypothetical protein J2Y45_003070 [Dyadobacter sp. BE34]|uniref:PH domain-containing protein n=1 Tax=Dyadobacter fermentans TaxID=94254 RepID=A0ABU1QU28_9BACT|nr:hypothetical protein [Dyadobacter fermentans]MDR7043619.1 hypothetical protein [Dyadobacter sp. BE242]MDR7197931.1 hypothetical protein [Dyadobacter sp. BE34]MDR7214636.1 hypothetical protein [Dyadobacter sp. BE31]MDR7262171.1 hypothetical protein [Dyadobacter sp. BE32]